MENYYYVGICIQRIDTLQISAYSYVNYAKRKDNCNLVVTSYILYHHMPENVAIVYTTNLYV